MLRANSGGLYGDAKRVDLEEQYHWRVFLANIICIVVGVYDVFAEGVTPQCPEQPSALEGLTMFCAEGDLAWVEPKRREFKAVLCVRCARTERVQGRRH